MLRKQFRVIRDELEMRGRMASLWKTEKTCTVVTGYDDRHNPITCGKVAWISAGKPYNNGYWCENVCEEHARTF